MAINDIVKIYRWSIPITEFAAVKFHNDNIYSLGQFGEGPGPFCRGTYKVMNNKIIMDYPFEIEEWLFVYEVSKKILDWVFEQNKTATFFYEHDYIDFYVRTCLRNGNKILKNHSIESPAGHIYNLDGVDVMKYDNHKSHVIITENLRMREKPSISAETVNLSVYLFWKSVTIKGNITHKNAIHGFDAITVRKDTIDGITAPWYRITVVLDETYARYVWVFGAYLKEIPYDDYKSNVRQYDDNYYDSLINSGVIKR
jgi:hypothetical protein